MASADAASLPQWPILRTSSSSRFQLSYTSYSHPSLRLATNWRIIPLNWTTQSVWNLCDTDAHISKPIYIAAHPNLSSALKRNP